MNLILRQKGEKSFVWIEIFLNIYDNMHRWVKLENKIWLATFLRSYLWYIQKAGQFFRKFRTQLRTPELFLHLGNSTVHLKFHIYFSSVKVLFRVTSKYPDESNTAFCRLNPLYISFFFDDSPVMSIVLSLNYLTLFWKLLWRGIQYFS